MSDKIIIDGGTIQLEGSSKDVSDGYHTFGELYHHRVLLYMALMISHPALSWRALYHHDGTCYEGSFLAGMQLPTGQISYHIPMEYWNILDNKKIETLDFAKVWDGHTSEDVAERIEAWMESL